MRRMMGTTLILAILAPGLVLADDREDAEEFWEEQEEFLEEQRERQEELWKEQRKREERYRRQRERQQKEHARRTGGWYGPGTYVPSPYSQFPSYPPGGYYGGPYQQNAPYYRDRAYDGGTYGNWFAPPQPPFSSGTPYPAHPGAHGAYGHSLGGVYTPWGRYQLRRTPFGGYGLDRYGAGQLDPYVEDWDD